jgi:hypothetical protein
MPCTKHHFMPRTLSAHFFVFVVVELLCLVVGWRCSCHGICCCWTYPCRNFLHPSLQHIHDHLFTKIFRFTRCRVFVLVLGYALHEKAHLCAFERYRIAGEDGPTLRGRLIHAREVMLEQLDCEYFFISVNQMLDLWEQSGLWFKRATSQPRPLNRA